MPCPFCFQDNDAGALVCNSCARDIVIPPSLIAERDGLADKLKAVRRELASATRELETLKPSRKPRIKAGKHNAL